MAKESDLLSPNYKSVKVAPAAAGAIGEVVQYNSLIGNYIEAITAAEVTASENRTLIVAANISKVEKTTGQAWVTGEPIYWDPATNHFTNVAGILQCCGYVFEAAASADTSGFIWLMGFPQAGNGLLMRSGTQAVTGSEADVDTGLTLISLAIVSIKDTTQAAGAAAYATYDHGADGLLDIYCWDDAGSAATEAATVAWVALGS